MTSLLREAFSSPPASMDSLSYGRSVLLALTRAFSALISPRVVLD